MRSKSILIAIMMSSASLVGCLGEDLGPYQDRIDELEEGSQVDAGIMEELNRTIDSQESSIAKLEVQVSSLQSSITGLDGQIASLQDSIGSLEAENGTNAEKISQLNSEVAALEMQKSELEGTVSSLQAAIAALDATIAALEAEKSDMEANLSLRFQEGYDVGYGDAYDASYDGVAQHYYGEGWDDGWEIATNDAQAAMEEMQELASTLNGTILGLQESAIECGEHTSLSDGICTSDSVVWGRLPFENGTPLTINQAFMGGWTHQEDWLYSVDFAKDEGTPIVSFKEGVVREIKEDSDTNCIDEGISRENCTHGNYVLIDHGDFTFALYLHLEQWSVDVEVGETVGRGHQIGRVGNTGYSTGPHLHFNVKNGFGYGGAKIVLFEELVGISNGIPFSGANVTSNNSNTSATAQVPPSICPSDAFAFRGVFLLSAVPCSMAEHDVEYNLTGYVASPGMDLQVAQYVESSAGNYWSYSCIDTSSTGSFSTILEWDSSVHGEWSYLMMSVTPDGDCYAYDSWWTSIGITMV